MRKFKQTVSILLTLVLLLSCLPMQVLAEEVVPSGTCGENLMWELDGNGTLTISGTGAMTDYEDGAAPWYSYRNSITAVVIEEGVTSVGDVAFAEHQNLASVMLADSVASIGSRAFGNCTSLTSVTIPSGVASIIGGAFSCCYNLKTIVFEGDAPSIDPYAFYDVTAMAIYPAGNDTWTEDVLQDYNGDITWRSLAEDGTIASGTCGDDTTWKMNLDGTLTISGTGEMDGWALADEPWYDYKSSITSVVIEDGVTSIGVSAFWGCEKITTVIIPDSVTSVDHYAFASCDNLTAVLFEGDTPTIDGGAFEWVTATAYYPVDNATWTANVMQNYGGTLTWQWYGDPMIIASGTCGEKLTWELNSVGTLTISGTGAMTDYGYVATPWYDYADSITSVVIEEGVTDLGEYAFCDCSNLTDIVLPESITEIANGSFAATGLTQIEIPDSVTSIGANAFADCKALKEIRFPESVTTIGELAFAGCNNLETVTLPSTITEIGGYAFTDCLNLSKIEFLGSAPQFGNGVFSYVTADAYYPADDTTWTVEIMEYFSGNLTWYASNGTLSLFRLSGTNVALGSSLAMNFFIDKDYLSGSDYYAVITHYDHEDLENGCHVYTIPYTQWEERQDYMVVTLENLAAKNMVDSIEVQIFRADGTPCSAVWHDSVQSYAMRIFDQQDAKTKTLLVDMLNYGAAAQTYFGYRDTYLVNEALTEEQQAYATQSVSCTNQRVEGDNYIGSTLVLENRIQLTMYFQNITTDMYAVVSYTDHDGNAQEYTVSGSNFAQYNANIYGVTVDTLAVADGDQLVTVTVYDGDENPLANASDTVNGYLSRMMSGDALFEAIAKFTNSAYAYFHQN